MKQYQRVYKDPHRSFFLFGPRGVGKSYWLKLNLNFAARFDLLNQQIFIELSRDPHQLYARLAHLNPGDWVCVDEVQKIPQLLDEVHALIEDKKLNFALSGSSA